VSEGTFGNDQVVCAFSRSCYIDKQKSRNIYTAVTNNQQHVFISSNMSREDELNMLKYK